MIHWRTGYQPIRPQQTQDGCLALFAMLIVGIVLGAAAVWGGGR